MRRVSLLAAAVLSVLVVGIAVSGCGSVVRTGVASPDLVGAAVDTEDHRTAPTVGQTFSLAGSNPQVSRRVLGATPELTVIEESRDLDSAGWAIIAVDAESGDERWVLDRSEFAVAATESTFWPTCSVLSNSLMVCIDAMAVGAGSPAADLVAFSLPSGERIFNALTTAWAGEPMVVTRAGDIVMVVHDENTDGTFHLQRRSGRTGVVQWTSALDLRSSARAAVRQNSGYFYGWEEGLGWWRVSVVDGASEATGDIRYQPLPNGRELQERDRDGASPVVAVLEAEHERWSSPGVAGWDRSVQDRGAVIVWPHGFQDPQTFDVRDQSSGDLLWTGEGEYFTLDDWIVVDGTARHWRTGSEIADVTGELVALGPTVAYFVDGERLLGYDRESLSSLWTVELRELFVDGFLSSGMPMVELSGAELLVTLGTTVLRFESKSA